LRAQHPPLRLVTRTAQSGTATPPSARAASSSRTPRTATGGTFFADIGVVRSDRRRDWRQQRRMLPPRVPTATAGRYTSSSQQTIDRVSISDSLTAAEILSSSMFVSGGPVGGAAVTFDAWNNDIGAHVATTASAVRSAGVAGQLRPLVFPKHHRTPPPLQEPLLQLTKTIFFDQHER
jgi:hypothetical protein